MSSKRLSCTIHGARVLVLLHMVLMQTATGAAAASTNPLGATATVPASVAAEPAAGLPRRLLALSPPPPLRLPDAPPPQAVFSPWYLSGDLVLSGLPFPDTSISGTTTEGYSSLADYDNWQPPAQYSGSSSTGGGGSSRSSPPRTLPPSSSGAGSAQQSSATSTVYLNFYGDSIRAALAAVSGGPRVLLDQATITPAVASSDTAVVMTVAFRIKSAAFTSQATTLLVGQQLYDTQGSGELRGSFLTALPPAVAGGMSSARRAALTLSFGDHLFVVRSPLLVVSPSPPLISKPDPGDDAEEEARKKKERVLLALLSLLAIPLCCLCYCCNRGSHGGGSTTNKPEWGSGAGWTGRAAGRSATAELKQQQAPRAEDYQARRASVLDGYLAIPKLPAMPHGARGGGAGQAAPGPAPLPPGPPPPPPFPLPEGFSWNSDPMYAVAMQEMAKPGR